ncbi:hypothetical protein [Glycomyces terrestris]|uniref:Uncharacterized protein n=1 Tax=Glycomyces terrestris TaxID=2493553 RepID=A0A426UT28_9ACTN|nr:hypothetical protein [Glycomyces terrestris]RRR96525.1 hypothetical protein EIW28_22095 [Glycomyces terrestris]
MGKAPTSHATSPPVWRRTTALVATFLVFGFVILMAVLGHNLIAATTAAVATSIAAAELARRLAYTDEGAQPTPTDAPEGD